MSTSKTRDDAVEVGNLPTGDPSEAGITESARSDLYLMSSLPAGVAILSVLVAILAAWSHLSNVAVIALWVFIVAAGLWVGGTVYILSLSGRRFWDRLRRAHTDRPTN